MKQPSEYDSITLKPKNLPDLEKYFNLHYIIRPIFRDKVKKNDGQINEHLDPHYFELEERWFFDDTEKLLMDIIPGYDPKEHSHDLVYLATYYENHSHRYMYGVDYNKGKRDFIFEIDSLLNEKTENELVELKDKAKKEITNEDLVCYREDVLLTEEERDDYPLQDENREEEMLRSYIYKKHIKPRGNPIIIDNDYVGLGNEKSYSIADIEEDKECDRILSRYHLHTFLKNQSGNNRKNLSISFKAYKDHEHKDETEQDIVESELLNDIITCLNDNLSPSLYEYYKDYSNIIKQLQQNWKKLSRVYTANVIKGLLEYIDNKIVPPGVHITQADKYEFSGTFLSIVGLGGIYSKEEYNKHPSIKNSYTTYRIYLNKRVSVLLDESTTKL